MSKKQSGSAQPAQFRALMSALIPLTLALVGVNALGGAGQNNSLPLGIAGLASWLMGMLWFRYGPAGLGLRGGRPWLAGGGFAVIGWIFLLLFRFIFVESGEVASSGAGERFLYLLIFEAFAVHLWVYGLFFRGLADYRGGLTAALVSGALFAVVAYFTYLEQSIFVNSLTTIIFLLSWGVFYGIVRLRSGSILGLIMVQPFQSLTAWFILQPAAQPELTALIFFHIATSLVFLILIWRLWPRTLEDHRV